VHHDRFADRATARRAIFNWITTYKTHGRHSSLGYIHRSSGRTSTVNPRPTRPRNQRDRPSGETSHLLERNQHMPSTDKLEATLEEAETSHHQFQTVYLNGVRDEKWASYYAAFVLGRLEDLGISPSKLTGLLAGVTDKNWTAGAAKAIQDALGN
jgi:hypothetical protein